MADVRSPEGPAPSDSESVTVPLSRGKVAIIDQADWPLVEPYSWYVKTARADTVLYAATTVNQPDGSRKTVRMHQLIMGSQPGQIVDHINFDGLDNRRSNLRFSDPSKNTHHQRKRVGEASQYKGVGWNRYRGAWQARLRVNGERGGHIGYFANELEAALAYDYAALEKMGEAASTNFPRELLEALRGRAAVGKPPPVKTHLTPDEAREFEAAKGPTTPLGGRPAEDAPRRGPTATLDERLLAIHDALMEKDLDEAYHQLYGILEPTYSIPMDPFALLRERVRAGVREGPDQPEGGTT